MTNTYFDWDATWTNTSINATTVSSNATSGVISNDNKVATEISVSVTYGGTSNSGLFVYVLRDVNGTDFETADDNPWGFELGFSPSVTRQKTFVVSADRVSDFKIYLVNNSGADVTVDVRYRQCVSKSV